jgi:polar amino acid transport system substrate-binding protein
MMKRTIFPRISLGICIAALALSACGNDGQGGGLNLKNAGDIKNKRIGVLVGSPDEAYIEEHYPDAVRVYIDVASDEVLALNNDKCDAALFSNNMIPSILERNPDIGILEENMISDPLGFAFNHNNPALRESFNEFLRELRASGELAAIYDRWLKDFQNTPTPALGGDGSGGLIRFGTTGIDIPNSAIRDGELVGYDIDIFYRFATKHNLKVETQKILFGGLIAALSSGKVDIIGSAISITEERAKQVAFSEPYADESVSMLALKKNIAAYAGQETAPATRTFWVGLGQSFQNNLIAEKRYMLIVKGLWVTLVISLFSALLGTVLGGLICFLRMSKNRFCNGFANVYIAVLRGTPILVLLMIMFYVIFAKVGINARAVAVIAFAMNFAAYVSEMFRTAIEGVNSGQTEAGIAMGFTKVSTFIHIVLPQAARRVMPVYKGEFISLVKMTSVVGYIAVEDLTKASDIISSRTFDAFFPLVLVAVIYFLLSWLCTALLGRIEISTDPRQRKVNP